MEEGKGKFGNNGNSIVNKVQFKKSTKRRTTTNLKTKNNQNCQKIELYGSPTTKELKKKHLYRLVGRAEDAQQGGNWRTGWVRWWLADWVVPHLHADKPGGTTGEQDRLYNPGFQYREIKPQTSEKTCGGCRGGINSQPRGRVCWRDPQGPRMYTNPPTWESAPKGPNFLLGSRGSD